MRNNIKGKTKKALVILVLVCFVIVSALSVAFVLVHEHHDCMGHGCKTCHQLYIVKQILKKQLQKVALATHHFSALFFPALLLHGLVSSWLCSLFTQKVKLNI